MRRSSETVGRRGQAVYAEEAFRMVSASAHGGERGGILRHRGTVRAAQSL